MKTICFAILLALTSAVPLSARAQTNPKLDLRDGDRVVFVGSTLLEREQEGGYIETMLVRHFPGKRVVFRNVAYSGDTVSGEARGLCTGWSTFETPQQGLNRLRKIIAEIKPTVLIVNYGMNESFNGPPKLDDFVAGLGMLLDMLAADATDGEGRGLRQVLLLSPNYHEDLGRPLPDPSEHNKDLKLYRDAIGALAAKRGCTFVDLFTLTQDLAKTQRLTGNGIHLTPYGYWRLAQSLEKELGLLSDNAMLPAPPSPSDERTAAADREASSQQVEKLRQLIVEKNFDFFNYFRPENDSYILSFRKKEQGRNAVELPQFKPLAEDKDRQIAELSVLH
jgi:lysophospholipase L1-like esterase